MPASYFVDRGDDRVELGGVNLSLDAQDGGNRVGEVDVVARPCPRVENSAGAANPWMPPRPGLRHSAPLGLAMISG